MEESGLSQFKSLCKFSFRSGEFSFIAEAFHPPGTNEGVAILYMGSGIPDTLDVDAIINWCDDSAQIICDRYGLDFDEITESFDLAIEKYLAQAILNEKQGGQYDE